MNRKQLEHCAFQVRAIWERVEGAPIFSSLEEALFLAHKFQRLPFATEYIRLLVEPVIVGIDHLMEIRPEPGKNKAPKYLEEQRLVVRALQELSQHIHARLESVSPW